MLVVAGLAALTWLHVDAWGRWSQQRAIAAAGVVEVGHVADLHAPTSPDAAADHRVEVALPDGGTVTDEVDEETYQRLAVGDPVRIGVDPDTGAGMVLGDDDPGRVVLLLTLVDVGLLAVVVVAAVRQRRTG